MNSSDDSDTSDYNVEDYIKPEVVRRTYNKNDDDLISGSNDESDSENEEQEELINCTSATNGKPEAAVVPAVTNEPESDDADEIARTNSRFILHISNINFGKISSSQNHQGFNNFPCRFHSSFHHGAFYGSWRSKSSQNPKEKTRWILFCGDER